jgi:type II secretory pathway pseudopilin PulG
VTLVELLVALVLTGLVAAAVLALLVLGQRAYRQQHAAAAVSATLRAAATMLPLELSGLDTLVATEPAAVSFQAARTLAFLCALPRVSGSRRGSLTVGEEPRYGMRAPDSRRDSVLVYAQADPASDHDDYWVRADLVDVGGTATCPGGAAGVTLELAAISPRGGLLDVHAGAPVWWLGARGRVKASGWSTIQPVLGPLAPNGFRLSYIAASGAPAARSGEVSRIGIWLVARAPAGRGAGPLQDSVWLEISLRNRRRF